jgi:putative oxygen-independent coproporphyrinogen III oxidase
MNLKPSPADVQRPRGVYVHLPFCTHHCTYCPFVVSTDLSLQDSYVDALVEEIVQRAGGEAVDTIYLGGGTPSRTSIDNLARVMAAIRSHFQVDGSAEVSMEANPEDVSAGSLALWRELGVNRVSIGVQSFHDDELAPLGRVHGRERAIAAVTDSVGSGVRTSLDLILGLPHQTASSFRETLDVAASLGAGHVSMYLLDLEEKTPLQTQVARGRVTLPDEDEVVSLYTEGVARLAAAGLRQYEVSNFAHSGEESRHNLRYWRREEYHGFGVGAHSFLGARRFANTRDIRAYIERELAHDVSPAFSEELGEGEARREELLLGLRQTAGLESTDIARLCGTEGTLWMERGVEDGWLRRDGSRVAFTPEGFLLSNDYIAQLF